MNYDEELYAEEDKKSSEYYYDNIADEDEDEMRQTRELKRTHRSGNASRITASQEQLDEVRLSAGPDHDPFSEHRQRKTIAEREDAYHTRRFNRTLSPERSDAFSETGSGASKGGDTRSYADIMRETEYEKERQDVLRKIQQKQDLKQQQQQADQVVFEESKRVTRENQNSLTTDNMATPRRKRWDIDTATTAVSEPQADSMNVSKSISDWDKPDSDRSEEKKSARSRWDETPVYPSSKDMTGKKRSRWDETPVHSGSESSSEAGSDTPLKKTRSRWDETPVHGMMTTSATPSQMVGGMTPLGSTMAMMTPFSHPAMTPDRIHAIRIEKELDVRNRPLSDEELDSIFPQDGYEILAPPPGYEPIRTPSRKLMATPTPYSGMSSRMTGFYMQDESISAQDHGMGAVSSEDLPFVKPEDYQYFGKLLEERDTSELTLDEIKQRKIMKLLLRIKNGTPPIRKTALRTITEKARDFGAGPLLDQILPLLMSPTLEDQERHLLVKVIDRILYKLDDLVRPYVHKILVVIEPLLIDEDYYARVEGREIISNLAKAAGLATMIATMRPDIDHVDEYVRNTTARAFAVVASALGIPALLPFLKAVCKSKKSWQARHTGIKIAQQTAILLGCAVLPHLKSLVECIQHGLTDEQQKVRMICALALASLAEASTPYGIESFDTVLKPLWRGIRQHRGKGLAAFLKAIGFIIPLMDAQYANYYTKEVMVVLIREFQSPDEEMKKIVLKVVKQCAATEGVESSYLRQEILPDFFKYYWVRRMALDRRNYKQLVETTVELANKVGVSDIVGRICDGLKDESEAFRRMVSETIEKVVMNLGTADMDEKLERTLIDGFLIAFQEQTTEDVIILNAFSSVVAALGQRMRPYLPQLNQVIKYRLNHKTARVRQQAADLIAKIAVVFRNCEEEGMLADWGVILYENLGEEYPDVLGSILSGLKGIVNVIGMTRMHPPIKDLLPRLTPILKNRHEKVQENCVDLVGRIADRGAEYVSPREWMRICFELIDLLKAPKKAIRRASVNTFGYIAKAIGPHDVLATLLNNLKVQERQMRVCTTVAVAIVAETCAPFTILPALMNEYRVPELNVQNGVLKSLSFLFEYIGEMGKDYIYAVTPLLEDALIDRDLVHRQTACTAVKHMALGVAGLNCEDALIHLLNFVWPNLFETSPHVINAVFEAVEALRVALGASRILYYLLSGLFHPARKVRAVYWRVYNSLYISSQDALVPAFPRVENDGYNTYQRYELDYIL